ncbi:MAG: serine hydrolase [Algicola sp.]|nr:serine hydrolase [Algicola sp.]
MKKMHILVMLMFSQSGFAQDLTAVMDLYAEEGQHNRIKSPFNGVMLVAKNDKILLKKAYGFYNREKNTANKTDSRFLIGSVTKQFTAMLVMQQVEKGLLSLDKTVSDYLPYFPKEKGQQMTLHRLLSHTSGLPHYEGLKRLGIDPRAFIREKISVPAYVKLIGQMDLINQPGTQFSYASNNYVLLGAILEQITGKTYAALIAHNIAKPLGLKNTGYPDNDFIEQHVAQGYKFTEFNFFKALISEDKGAYKADGFRSQSTAYATGGLYSTVDDLFVWSKAVKNHTLLSPAMTKKMLTPNLAGYGYGWFINQETYMRFNPSVQLTVHGGTLDGFASNVALYDDGTSVIYLSNVTPVGDVRLTMYMHLAANNIDIDDFKRDIRLPNVNGDFDDFMDDGGMKGMSVYYKELSRRAGYKISHGQWGYEELIGLHTVEGKIAEAEKLAEDLLAEHSTPQRRRINDIGYHFVEQEAYAQAIKYFTLNVKSYPYSANVHDSLGEAYFKNGQYKLALEYYQRAVSIAKTNSDRNLPGFVDHLEQAKEELAE